MTVVETVTTHWVDAGGSVAYLEGRFVGSKKTEVPVWLVVVGAVVTITTALGSIGLGALAHYTRNEQLQHQDAQASATMPGHVIATATSAASEYVASAQTSLVAPSEVSLLAAGRDFNKANGEVFSTLSTFFGAETSLPDDWRDLTKEIARYVALGSSTDPAERAASVSSILDYLKAAEVTENPQCVFDDLERQSLVTGAADPAFKANFRQAGDCLNLKLINFGADIAKAPSPQYDPDRRSWWHKLF